MCKCCLFAYSWYTKANRTRAATITLRLHYWLDSHLILFHISTTAHHTTRRLPTNQWNFFSVFMSGIFSLRFAQRWRWCLRTFIRDIQSFTIQKAFGCRHIEICYGEIKSKARKVNFQNYFGREYCQKFSNLLVFIIWPRRCNSRRFSRWISFHLSHSFWVFFNLKTTWGCVLGVWKSIAGPALWTFKHECFYQQFTKHQTTPSIS